MTISGRRFATACFGTNPWPSAGPLGHLAPMVAAGVFLLFLLPLGLALGSGYPALVATDFVAYLTAARLVAAGQATQIYDAAAQGAAQAPLLQTAGVTSPNVVAYVNPPLLAALLVPLVPLGLQAGSLLWLLGNLATAAAMVGVAARRHWRAALLTLTFMPFLEALYFGQVVALMLLGLGGWFLFSRARRPWLAGFALSLLGLKPQYAPVMVLYLAWKRQWTQLLAFSLVGLVQLAATALLLLSGNTPFGLEALMPYLRFGGESNVVVHLQLNLRGAIWHLLPWVEPTGQLVVLGLATAIALVAFFCFVDRTWWPSASAGASEQRFTWEVLALLAFVPLTAYHNNLLHLYLLLPPAAALLARPPTHAAPDPRLVWLSALFLLPSLGMVIGLAFNTYIYYFTGWMVALGFVILGLRAMNRTPTDNPATRSL